MQNELYQYQVIKTLSGQVGYLQLGDNSHPPLILLVGYSGNLLHWNKEFVLELARLYSVYLIDNRLIGESRSINLESIHGFALDIIDFMNALALDKVSIIGWSMGGLVAQNMAIFYPKRINKLILLGSLPDYSFTYGGLHDMVKKLRDNPSKLNRDKLLQLFYSQPLTIDFRKYLARNMLSIEGYNYQFNEAAQYLQDGAITSYIIDYQLVKSIYQPSLIFTAKNDLVNKPEGSYLLHQLISDSQLISYPLGGHFFINFYAISVAKQIITFLQGEINV